MNRWNCLFLLLLVGLAPMPGCADDIEPPSLPGLQVRELKSPLFTPTSPVSLVFQVGEQTNSLQLLFNQLGSDGLEPVKLVSPSGDVVLDVENGIERNAGTVADRSMVLQIPTHPSEQVEPGPWIVTLLSDGEVLPEIHLIERVSPVEESRVELSLRFLGLEGDENTPVPQDLEAVIHEASELLTDGGGPRLSIEDSQWISPEEGAPFQSITEVGRYGGIEDLLYLAFPPGDRRLGVYIVREISRAEGKGAVASWSGGIPGPVWSPTGERRGVILAIPDWEDIQVEDLGRHLAHSIAHYLGSEHTTEANGQDLYGDSKAELGQDALESTPVCPDSQDLDEDLFLTWGECSGWDGNNLMFWNPLPISTELLPEQGEQMLLHPLVR